MSNIDPRKVTLKTVLAIVGIKKKTKAKMFEELVVGDILKLTTELGEAGFGYAPYVKVTCQRTNESVNKSFAECRNVLTSFELQEVS